MRPGPALRWAAALQYQDGLVRQLVAGRVRLVQLVQERLKLSGQQDLALHTALSRAGPDHAVRLNNIRSTTQSLALMEVTDSYARVP